MPTPRIHTGQAERQRAYRQRQAAARAAELALKGIPPAPAIPTMPSRQRWAGLLATAQEAIDTAREEMQAYWDSRTGRWQESDRGAAMEVRIAQLEEVATDLAEAAAEGE
jgi:hypothetical protein